MSVNQKGYRIWIGDKIEGVKDFADIPFHKYFANRQMIILDLDVDIDDRVLTKRFSDSGGTLLMVNAGEVKLVDFRPFGEDNITSWSGEYLLSTIELQDRSTNRVNYAEPGRRGSLCSRVIGKNGAYMITYNVRALERTFDVFPEFIESLKKPKTIEGSIDPDFVERQTSFHKHVHPGPQSVEDPLKP